MINITNLPVDVEEVRMWLVGYRNMADPPIPWSQLAKETEIPAGTLQPFAAGKYQGDNEKIARKLFQFRQSVEQQALRQKTLPTNPGFFQTDTSQRLQMLLEVAHMGRITVGATGPGTGKTMTVREYAEQAQPVWIATMKPSCARLGAMIKEVHRALGLEPRNIPVAEASRIVLDRVRQRRGLLVIDEANYLTIDSIEEIRSWHDETGVGVCLLGNEELLARIETGRHRDQFARLNRRIAMRHTQRVPLPGDVRAFCDAWGITQPDIRHYLDTIARTPDSGGLGECQQLIESGSMLAAADDRGLSLADLREAQMFRATKWIKT
ncbi:MAG: AAA family ATPase [Erythrobacter sp.]